MNRILIDVLDAGHIPAYEFGNRFYYVWQGGCWNIMTYNGRRALISTEIDEPLTLFVDELPGRLADLVPGHLTVLEGAEGSDPSTAAETEAALNAPGTLVLSLRCCEKWDNLDSWLDTDGRGRVRDRHGVLIMGGLAFFPGVEEGEPLRGIDPTYFIEQACLGFAGLEYDRQVPAIRDFIARRWMERSNQTAKRLAATEKAQEILRDHLDDAQLAEYDAQGQFHVVGGDGFTYLITSKACHNVFRVIEGDVRVIEYCIVTEEPVPLPDQILTQKLLLEADPVMFHEKTNAWSLIGDKRSMVSFLDPATFEVRPLDVAIQDLIRRVVG